MTLHHEFRVHRVPSVDEALTLLEKYGDDAVVYAGGTELVLLLKFGLTSARHLVDVSAIPEMVGADLTPQSTLRIGAATTHWALQSAPAVKAGWPTLATMERTIGNIRVQTAGTIGGNLCFADPQSDPATYLVAADASVVCASAGGQKRTLPLNEFLIDSYTTDLRDGEELLETIEVPLLPAGACVVHRKFAIGERPNVTCAMYLAVAGDRVVDARVVLGSITGAPTTVRVSDQLLGLSLDEASASATAFSHACIDEVTEFLLSDKRDRYTNSLARSLVASVAIESVRSCANLRGSSEQGLGGHEI